MDILLVILSSLILTAISIPLTIKFAHKLGLVDDPSLRPHPAHIHQMVLPRAGGLACFIGVVTTILLFIPLEKHILGLILGLTILLLLGLYDDRKPNFSPYLRLSIQILAAVVVVLSGVGIPFITNPLGGIIMLGYFGDILAVIWIVWVMNMINWSKGVDGQMPGIVLISSIILGLLSIKFFLDGDISQLQTTKLSFLISGASLGFLIFNWYPAKILPGFSASTIFGLLIATVSILSGAKLATALLALLVPAADFLYTFVRRVLQGKSPVWGDRKHLHHHLLNLKFSHQQIALFYMLGSAILGSAALTLESKGKLFALALIGLIILGSILWLNFFGASSNQPDPDNG